MSNGLVAFMLGIGVAAWVYNKLYRTTGGNTKNALTAAAVVGVLGFVVMFMIMNALV